MKRPVHWVLGLVGLVLGMCVEAQVPQEKPTENLLLGLNASLEQLSTKVSPAVVHIEVVSYGSAADDGDDTKVQTLSKQRGSGSGVTVDPEGYIVTAPHVVEGARRIHIAVKSHIPSRTTWEL